MKTIIFIIKYTYKNTVNQNKIENICKLELSVSIND